jgi:hypothetical protein
MGVHPATGSHVSVTHISSMFHGNAGKLNAKKVITFFTFMVPCIVNVFL